jgi:hypothetical protein
LANVPAYFASMTFFSIYMDILLLGLKKKRKKYQDFKQRQTRLKHSDKENSWKVQVGQVKPLGHHWKKDRSYKLWA